MQSKLLVLPIVGLLLTGCDNWKKLTGTNDTLIPKPPGVPVKSQPKGPLTILVMGQSNALNLVLGSMGGLEPGQDGAARMSDDLGRKVIMINCAVGGTSMLQWQKSQPLYDNCLASIQGKHIDYIWFDQGEYELETDKSQEPMWGQNFMSMYRALQRDLPDVPLYFARIDYFLWSGTDIFNDLYQQQNSIKGPIMVSLDEVTYDKAHWPHFPHQGYMDIADRLAAALQGKDESN